mgnify:CR=1 FL=1
MNVLIAEDEVRLANAIAQILRENKYQVDVTYNGKDALAYVTGADYDVFVCDVMLPGMDGFQIVHEARKQGVSTPIIMLTARTSLSDKVTGLDAGADDYLTKPFSVDELLARVRANLRRSSMASSESTEASTFDNGPLHIDYAAGYATKDGRELSLTPTEYKLLVLLAKNVDKVLTHTFITREIWGTSWDSDLASLRVFMRTLRKKIEADPSHPKMIQTHMGVGYRMQRL